MRCVLRRGVLLGAVLAVPAAAQEGTLDVLDGETLYEKGGLITLGVEIEQRLSMRSGSGRVSDPLDRRQTDHTLSLAAHYGLRNNLQLSLVAPYVRRVREQDDPAGPDRLATEGLGDVTTLAKWRFYRWDAPHKALNLAAIAGVELPTGSAHEREDGVRLPLDLQPGSGSVDPFGGFAATYEPGRWRFNTFAVYKRNEENGHDDKFGDEFHAELAAGNRFWLKPYPGPFMRLDAILRYHHEGRGRLDGDPDPDSGFDRLTVGANYAFRPRPTLDFQVGVEVPVAQTYEGVQLAEAYSVFFAFGYRF